MHWSVCSRRQVRSPACRPGTSADRPRDAHTHTHHASGEERAGRRATLATAPHWTGNKRRTDSLAPCTTTETKQKQQLRVDHWRVLSAPRPRTPASTTQPHCCRLARRSWSLRPSSSLSSTFIAYHCIYTAKQLQSRQKLLGIIHKCGHGRGVFKLVGPTGYSYSGRPQTVLFWITIVTFCCPATWLRLNGPVIPFYYRPIMNLVLQSNFEFCMFCLLIILLIH